MLGEDATLLRRPGPRKTCQKTSARDHCEYAILTERLDACKSTRITLLREYASLDARPGPRKLHEDATLTERLETFESSTNIVQDLCVSMSPCLQDWEPTRHIKKAFAPDQCISMLRDMAWPGKQQREGGDT